MIELMRGFFDDQDAGGLVAAYLFGSHAQGRAHADSDVDIGVLLDRRVLPTPEARFDRRLRLAARLDEFLGAGVRADVLVLNDAPPLVGRAVVGQGVALIVRDPELDHAYRRDVQLRAADLEPFLRRMRRIKLKALAG